MENLKLEKNQGCLDLEISCIFTLYLVLFSHVKFITTHEILLMYNVVVVQLLSSVQLFATPWTIACQATWIIAKAKNFY